MIDELETKGIKINIEQLSKQIGVQLHSISSKYGTGIETIISEIEQNKFLTPKPFIALPENSISIINEASRQ